MRVSQQMILLWVQPCGVGDGRGRRAEPSTQQVKSNQSPGGLGTAVGGCACVLSPCMESCPTLCDFMGCSRQAPLSMGFSRLEY